MITPVVERGVQTYCYVRVMDTTAYDAQLTEQSSENIPTIQSPKFDVKVMVTGGVFVEEGASVNGEY